MYSRLYHLGVDNTILTHLSVSILVIKHWIAMFSYQFQCVGRICGPRQLNSNSPLRTTPSPTPQTRLSLGLFLTAFPDLDPAPALHSNFHLSNLVPSIVECMFYSLYPSNTTLPSLKETHKPSPCQHHTFL